MARLANSESELVRYQSILALGAIDTPVTREALITSAQQFDDSWTRIALLTSVSGWAGDFSKALLAAGSHDGSIEDQMFYRQLGTLMAATDEPVSNFNHYATLSPNQLALDAGYLEALAATGAAIPGFSQRFIDQLLALARNQDSDFQAQTAIEILGYPGSERVCQVLLQIVLNSQSEEIQASGIKTLARQNDSHLSNELFKNASSFNPSVRKQLVSSALSSDASAVALLNALESNSIGTNEIPEELRHALLAHTDKVIKSRAETIIGAAVNGDRQEVIDQYLASLNNQVVDLKHGGVIFGNHCSVCHAINGEGGLLGPDLTNIGNRSDEVLMVNILDPSRMVSYELKLHVIVTNTGEVYSGTISSETTSSVTVRQPNGTEHTILRDNIKENTVTDQSIMPEGFERMIDEKGMADLIGFLRQPVAY